MSARRSTHSLGILIAMAVLLATKVAAQQPSSPQPQTASAPADYGPQVQQPQRAPIPIRQLFAGTLAAIVQGVTGGLAMSVTQGVTGSITGWFAKQQRKHGIAPTGASDPYAQAANPAGYPPAAGPPPGSYPASPPVFDPYAGATATAPPGGTPNGSAPAAVYDPYGTPVYDARTGQVDPNGAASYATPNAANEPVLYAGVAYEVHALGPNGESYAVNAATHQFHTGDRFTVHFRPSVSGRMEVYNINPLGQQSLIDAVNMSAGQLSTLGPYEFAATKGDESLRLVLSPCSNPALAAGTRDIVNVSGSTAASGLALVDCSAPATRSVSEIRTRDIRKVVVDGSTSFALDPVTRTELTSGALAPREITIVFHHL